MSFRCRFNFRDSRARTTSRTFVNDEPLIATVLTDIATLAGLWDVITDAELVNVVITQVDATEAFAGAATSNIDENTSVKVQGADGRIYDVDLPDLPDALHPIAALDITNIGITNFFDEFAVGNNWRVNLNNPTDVTAILSGLLDK